VLRTAHSILTILVSHVHDGLEHLAHATSPGSSALRHTPASGNNLQISIHLPLQLQAFFDLQQPLLSHLESRYRKHLLGLALCKATPEMGREEKPVGSRTRP
jgi:hypothetical protein